MAGSNSALNVLIEKLHQLPLQVSASMKLFGIYVWQLILARYSRKTKRKFRSRIVPACVFLERFVQNVQLEINNVSTTANTSRT